MSRRIQVRISSIGDIIVEAQGFHGKGCEAATKAIEDALGRTKDRSRKPDFWRQAQCHSNAQTLGGGSTP